MKKAETRGWITGFAVGTVVALVALVVVGLLAYHSVGIGWPQPGQQLVQTGVQSVTICEEHDFPVLDRLTRKMPGEGVGLWGPAKKGGCTT
jgi:hypothetical protein